MKKNKINSIVDIKNVNVTSVVGGKCNCVCSTLLIKDYSKVIEAKRQIFYSMEDYRRSSANAGVVLQNEGFLNTPRECARNCMDKYFANFKSCTDEENLTPQLTAYTD